MPIIIRFEESIEVLKEFSTIRETRESLVKNIKFPIEIYDNDDASITCDSAKELLKLFGFQKITNEEYEVLKRLGLLSVGYMPDLDAYRTAL